MKGTLICLSYDDDDDDDDVIAVRVEGKIWERIQPNGLLFVVFRALRKAPFFHDVWVREKLSLTKKEKKKIERERNRRYRQQESVCSNSVLGTEQETRSLIPSERTKERNDSIIAVLLLYSIPLYSTLLYLNSFLHLQSERSKSQKVNSFRFRVWGREVL